ncbi:MAG: hypothetical protein EOO62_01460 [Hymenobacter sp.]|nr:MAG: hypothetical protein EOO62_01460 [Hymenobacter sp.]
MAAERLRHLPWQGLAICGWLAGLCLYSFYIGRHNTENLSTTLVSVGARYRLVPYGVFDELTVKLGLPLLVLSCLLNVRLVRRLLPPTAEARYIVRVLQWLGWFILVYVLLLPLGGYRVYRPLILRHDSILPITLGLIGFYALSTGFLLRSLRGPALRWYGAGVGAVALIFMIADRRLAPRHDNTCERQALAVLGQACPRPVVQLPDNCAVLSWDPITNPIESLTNAELLAHWGVTHGLQPYYYKAP